MTSDAPLLGALVVDDGVAFGAFVTTAEACSVRVFTEDTSTTHAMAPVGVGYFAATVRGLSHGARYKLVLGKRAAGSDELVEREVPDPFARWLPEGVHGAASVFQSRRPRRAAPFTPRAPHERVIYELHVGTFTPEGTYASAATRLPELRRLGITTVELMPISAANGRWGWGYDGVAHFASHAPYGDPDEARAFIDAAHDAGLEVLLDVVYNHFGPSGSYLGAFCPEVFREDHQTPWGAALDYRHPLMRRYLLDSARYWLEDVGFDGLRLDATATIVDDSIVHVLAALAAMVATLSPRKFLVAEDDRNDPRLVTQVGLDGIWADDFHHAVHVSLTGERDGYYEAFAGGAEELARAISGGWLYRGEHYAPTGAPRGHDAAGLEPHHFVYCIQNHDQIGNRAFGDRLPGDAGWAGLCALTALWLFLPMTPLFFMGQEWGATSPFLYFTDHDEELGRLITAGRRREFGRFAAFATPTARVRIPDPQSSSTFERSKLRWEERERPEHARILSLHGELLALRQRDDVLSRPCERRDLGAEAHGSVLVCERRSGDARRHLLVNVGAREAERPPVPGLAGTRVLHAINTEGFDRPPPPTLGPWAALLLAPGGDETHERASSVAPER